MPSINNVTLIGRIVRDLEVKTTNTGKSVSSFALAVDGYGKDAPANFIDCVAWNKAAENLAEYAPKGKQIAITGRLQTRPWEDKNGNKRKATEVVVNDFLLLGSKGDGSNAAPATERYQQENTDAAEGVDDQPIDLSEIPF